MVRISRGSDSNAGMMMNMDLIRASGNSSSNLQQQSALKPSEARGVGSAAVSGQTLHALTEESPSKTETESPSP